MTEGSQKWQGAIPNFIIRLTINIAEVLGEAGERAAVSKIAEASAWIRKYLIAASFSWLVCVSVIRGIKEYKLSSRPIQIDSQLLDVNVIIIPRMRVAENSRL